MSKSQINLQKFCKFFAQNIFVKCFAKNSQKNAKKLQKNCKKIAKKLQKNCKKIEKKLQKNCIKFAKFLHILQKVLQFRPREESVRLLRHVNWYLRARNSFSVLYMSYKL